LECNVKNYVSDSRSNEFEASTARLYMGVCICYVITVKFSGNK